MRSALGMKSLAVMSFTCIAATAWAEKPSALSNLAKKSEPKQETSKPVSSAEAELLQREFVSSSDSTLESYKKIFNDEVAPYPALFFIGAGPNPEVLPSTDDHADHRVDRDQLWRYLRFSAKDTSTICFLSRAESGCALCEQLKSELHGALAERFARRGFSVRAAPALPAQLTAQSTLRGDRAFEELQTRVVSERLEDVQTANCDGVLYAEIMSGKVTGILDIKDVSKRKIRAKVETLIPSKDYSVQALARLISAHQCVGFFSMQPTETVVQIAAGQKGFGVEKYLEVLGLDSFLKYQNFKQAFGETFPQYAIEDRIIKQQSFRFALPDDAALDSIVVKLKQAPAFVSRGLRVEVIKSAAEEAVITLRER